MNKLLSITLLSVFIVACTPTEPSNSDETSQMKQKIIVSTSFYPMTHFTEQVGGDLIEIRQVAAQGTDPHTYEPTPAQIKDIFASDVFIFNGAGQDPYADRLHNELEGSGMRVLIATELVERMTYEREEHEHEDHAEDEHKEEEEEHRDEEEHDDHDDHEHGEWDPHVWLDPQRAEQIVQAIAEELSSLDPSWANQFQANASAYVSELQTLDNDMQAGLSNCALDAVIVSHDAYRYLANRYNFYTFEIAGLSPSSEPSPARLAELTEIAEEEGIEHVFFETQVSPALSETLANEIGAETLVLHSIEALSQEERSSGMTYVRLMRQNLANLRTALQCS